MDPRPDPKHVDRMTADIEQLWKAEWHRIGDFIARPIYDRHTFQGIYVISDQEDAEPLYIGKTNDGAREKGLADRICGHAETGSQLQRALDIDRAAFRQYRVRALRIDDPLQRGLSELYGISIFRPKANRVARLQAIPSYDDPQLSDTQKA